jgi:hypothetical protein
MEEVHMEPFGNVSPDFVPDIEYAESTDTAAVELQPDELTRHTQVLSEYMGDTDTHALLNLPLVNTNLRFSPVPELLRILNEPLVVSAEVEYTWAEGSDPKHDHPVSKRFVRLVIEANSA